MLKNFLLATLIGILGSGSVYANDVKPTPYRPIETIFASDTITVSGKIMNYTPTTEVKVMELEIHDMALGKNIPVSIPVKPDGSFSRRFFLPMAQTAVLKLNNYWISFDVYLEPQNDLEILIDYDKMLEQKTAGESSFADCLTFGGSLGNINAEIIAGPAKSKGIEHTIKSDVNPQDAKRLILDHHAAKAAEIETYIADKKVSDKAAGILRNSALSARTIDLLSYADFDSPVSTLPEEFYADVLRDAFSADSTILATDALFMLNRIGFTNILPEKRITVNVPEFRKMLDTVNGYGVGFNDDEKQKITKVANTGLPDSVQECLQIDLLWMANALISAATRVGKDKEVRTLILEESDEESPFSPKTETNTEFIKRITGKDELPLVWQFAVTAKEGNDAKDFLPVMTSEYGITHPHLIQRVTDAATPKDGATKLPLTAGGAIMRQLIEPFKGKYLLVDFWDIYCGPCRAGIESNKEMRESHRGNPGFAFLFLASEKGSPLDKYNAYVEKNLKGENVKRLPENQMILLRELFEFNSIPRYILFNPDGEVVNSNYSIYNFWELLKEKGLIDESKND